MFRGSFLLVLTIIPAAFNQLISFKDGKIGVNFAGYHAEAGLGGLLTGDAAHGGLSASAGTPFGQKAGAGIGGTVDNGSSRGGAYAGASAGYGVGASAALGGNVGEHGGAGGLGSEAHAGGVSTKSVKLSQTPQQPLIPQQTVHLERRFEAPPPQQNYVAYAPLQPPSSAPSSNFDYRKFFDFGFFSNAAASYGGAPHPAHHTGHAFSYEKQLTPNTVVLHKSVVPAGTVQHIPEQQANVDQRFRDDGGYSEESYEHETNARASVPVNEVAGSTTYTATKQYQANPNFFNDIFNIPISTLGAVSQFLSNSAGSGKVAVTKTVEVGQH